MIRHSCNYLSTLRRYSSSLIPLLSLFKNRGEYKLRRHRLSPNKQLPSIDSYIFQPNSVSNGSTVFIVGIHFSQITKLVSCSVMQIRCPSSFGGNMTTHVVVAAVHCNHCRTLECVVQCNEMRYLHQLQTPLTCPV